MQFIIGGIQKTSLLDFPNKISAIVFTKGCNFNCGYCHNPNLVKPKTQEDIYSTDVFLEFLKKRQGKLDGVVITGGEATLQKDLIPFIKEIRNLGFLIKLDTNGYLPNVVDDVIKQGLVDYIAMDIKAPIDKYSLITRIDVDTSKIEKSIDIIMNSGIDYEFRTTVLKSQLNYNDFENIGKLIKGARKYYLQKFEAKTDILDMSLKYEESYSDIEFQDIIKILKKYIDFVEIRN